MTSQRVRSQVSEPEIDDAQVQRVRGGKYDGPEAHVLAPWKCPACGVEQVGRVELGCPSCGSGKPGVHVGVQQAARVAQGRPLQISSGLEGNSIVRLAKQWLLDTTDATAIDGFLAGYEAGLLEGRRALLAQAPPVTADLTRLSPEGKTYRTIIAALEMFVDGVLRGNPEEILSGEWCSIEEAKALIEQLRPGAET